MKNRLFWVALFVICAQLHADEIPSMDPEVFAETNSFAENCIGSDCSVGSECPDGDCSASETFVRQCQADLECVTPQVCLQGLCKYAD